jgi:hypothetical protein
MQGRLAPTGFLLRGRTGDGVVARFRLRPAHVEPVDVAIERTLPILAIHNVRARKNVVNDRRDEAVITRLQGAAMNRASPLILDDSGGGPPAASRLE